MNIRLKSRKLLLEVYFQKSTEELVVLPVSCLANARLLAGHVEHLQSQSNNLRLGGMREVGHTVQHQLFVEGSQLLLTFEL